MLSDQIKNLIEWRTRIVTVVALTLTISRVVERTRTDVAWPTRTLGRSTYKRRLGVDVVAQHVTTVDGHPYIPIVGIDLGAGSGSESFDGEGVVLSLDASDRLNAD